MFWRPRDLGLRSHVAVGIAALALVIVDSVVAGTRGGVGASSPSIGGREPPLRMIGHAVVADAVTSGHDEIWTLHCFLPRRGRRCEVFELSPRNGIEVGDFFVPRPATSLFYGAGRLWVTGGRRISAIDPVTHRIATSRLAAGSVGSLAFRGSRA